MKNTTPPQFMTVEEVASVLRVQKKKVYKWIRDGRLRAFRIEGARVTRIRREDFEAFIRENTTTGEKA